MKARSTPSHDASASDPTALVFGYVAERARRWLDEDLKRTRAGLARKAGLRADQIHELLNGERRPTERSMRAVARALGIDFEDLEQSAAQWIASAETFSGVGAQRRSTDESIRVVGPSHPAPLAGGRYPNRAKAVEAAALLEHDHRDVETVLAIVLPPGTPDPAPRAWMSWIERAREERLAAAPTRKRSRRTP
jgi:transcriptional regulator with XRE-family HTH domain